MKDLHLSLFHLPALFNLALSSASSIAIVRPALAVPATSAKLIISADAKAEPAAARRARKDDSALTA